MTSLSEIQKKRLARFAKVSGKGEIGILGEINAIDERVDIVEANVNKAATTAEEALAIAEKTQKTVIQGPQGEKPVPGVDFPIPKDGEPGKPGESYVLTDTDKKEIAATITVPVVEKIVENIIHEQPIVTEKVVQVAVPETAEVIVTKLQGYDKPGWLDIEDVKDLREELELAKKNGGEHRVIGANRNLYQLLDVNVAGITTNQSIKWDGTQWIAYTPTTFTPPLTTKGDIFGYSTINARIPVGTNGQVLTADSTAALGVRYCTPSLTTPASPEGAIQINKLGVFGSLDGMVVDETGNARGTNALDIQSLRSAPTQVASGNHAIAYGAYNTASSSSSSAIGFNNTASGSYGSTTAVGVGNIVSGNCSSGIGFINTVSGYYSIGAGFCNTVSGTYNTAVGRANVASSANSTAIGAFNTSSGAASSSLGFCNFSTDTSASAIGSYNCATAPAAMAFGYQNNVSNNFASAFGQINNVFCVNSAAFGNCNTVCGTTSTASGYQNIITADKAIVLGNCITNCTTCSAEMGPVNTEKIRVSAAGINLITSTGQYLRNGTPIPSGTFCLPSLTSGSVLFSNGTTIAQDNSNFFWDDTNNRLGLGTTTPQGVLDVYTSSTGRFLIAPWAGASSYMAVGLSYTTTGVNNWNFLASSSAGNFYINRPTGGDMYFYEGGTSVQATLQATTGNLGVGTLTPPNRISIYTTTIADGLSIDGTGDQAIVLRKNGTIKAYAPVLAGSAGSFFFNAADGDMVFRSEANSILFGQGASNATLAVVAANVGIGTVAPAEALEVVGNIRNSALTASKLVLTDSSKNLISGTTVNLATAGIPTVVASTFEKAETGTDANILTYTVGGTDEYLVLQGSIDLSALTGTSVTYKVTWTDSNNVSQTSSVVLTGVSDGTLNIPVNGKTGTNVVFSTTAVALVSTAYNVSAIVTRLK